MSGDSLNIQVFPQGDFIRYFKKVTIRVKPGSEVRQIQIITAGWLAALKKKKKKVHWAPTVSHHKNVGIYWIQYRDYWVIERQGCEIYIKLNDTALPSGLTFEEFVE